MSSDSNQGCVDEPLRTILKVEAVVVLVALIVCYARLHASWLLFGILILAPDVAMAGYLRSTRIGAWIYNAFHSYIAPVVCFGFSLYDRTFLALAIIWAAHIAMDRALGYGLKYGDSFTHTHLGSKP